jgi:hypothetical protein
VLEIPPDANPGEVAAAHRADPHVEYAHLDYLIATESLPLPNIGIVPNDPHLEDELNTAVESPLLADVDGDGRTHIITSFFLGTDFFATNPIYAWNASGELLPGQYRRGVRADQQPGFGSRAGQHPAAEAGDGAAGLGAPPATPCRRPRRTASP